jgi:hypothetical protein
MGIRFLCPNGHKVHVKAYLAGKKGHCPKCGTMVTVPTADSLPETVDDLGFGETDDVHFPNHAPSHAVPAPLAAHPPAAPDPLVDPLAVWYVNLPTGQQLGPTGGREMQRWLEQGAVVPSALVWRDGWADWQPASRVFPKHVTMAEPVLGSAPTTIGIDTTQSPVPSAAMYRRRGRRRIPAGLTLMLMGLVVVLFAVLMYVFVLRSS